MVNNNSKDITFRALEAGALSVIEKPMNIGSQDFDKKCEKIVDTVRSMAEIKVIKRRFHTNKLRNQSNTELKSPKKTFLHPENFEVVAIGTSVGGPQALKEIFSKLPGDFPIPIVVVQHMAQGFIGAFTEWLNENSKLTIKRAENNELLLPHIIYFAPDNCHLEIGRTGKKLIAKLVSGAPVSGFCPSATMLIRSVAKVSGKNAVGILLTGMGNDGAQGLLELKKAEGHTLIQDQESAVVFGMGAVAQSLGGVDRVISLSDIADYLIKITARKN